MYMFIIDYQWKGITINTINENEQFRSPSRGIIGIMITS